MNGNLKIVLDVLLEGANVTDAIVQDVKSGKGFAAAGHLLSVVDEIMQLPGVEWSQLDDELKASRADGHADLKAHVKAKLDLDNDKAEGLVEEALSLLGTLDASISQVHKIASLAK